MEFSSFKNIARTAASSVQVLIDKELVTKLFLACACKMATGWNAPQGVENVISLNPMIGVKYICKALRHIVGSVY